MVEPPPLLEEEDKIGKKPNNRNIASRLAHVAKLVGGRMCSKALLTSKEGGRKAPFIGWGKEECRMCGIQNSKAGYCSNQEQISSGLVETKMKMAKSISLAVRFSHGSSS